MLSQFHHRKVHHGGLFRALSIGLFHKSGFKNERKLTTAVYAEFLTLLVLLLIIKKLENISK